MTSSLVNCPLCCQPAFNSLAALSMSLINVATKSLDCPVCHESLPGLDKFTIHIFGHALSHEIGGYKSQQNGVLKLSHVVDHEIGHKSQENALKVVASTSSHETAHKSLENSILRLSRSEIGVKSQENCVLKLSHLVDHEIGQKSQHHSDLSQNHKVIVKTADQNAPIGLDLAFGKTKIQNPGLPMFIRRIDCSTAKESLVVEKSINFHESQLVTSKTDETVVLENVPNLNEFRLVNRLTTDYVMENASNPIETPPLVGLGNDDNNNNKDEKMIGNFDNRMSNSSCGRNNVTNDNCGNNYINRESGSITDNNCWNIDTNRDRVSSMSNKAFVTDVGNLIGTKDDDVTSRNSMEGIVTVTDKNFDNSILSSNNGVAYTDDKIDKNFDNSILSSNNVVDVAMRCDIVTNQTNSSSRNENDTHLISFNEDTCVGSTESNSMSQEADNNIEAECNSVTKIDDSSVCDYREYRIIQEGDNGLKCDSMKNTDDSTPSYNVLNSDNILEYSEDSSNDLLKNLEPFIKYSAENVGRKIRKQNLVKGNSENVDLSIEESEETSRFKNNMRENCSNFVESSCENVITFLKDNEVPVNIIGSNVSSISDRSMEFTNTSPIEHNIVVKEIVRNHFEIIPMLFESQSNANLQNDASTSKTKSPKKDLRRKVCKKLLDSAMTTTQGVQTMEESFTKNNNPFGKFSNFDRNSEEFLDTGERNMESYERTMESDGRNIESGERNLRFDGGNLITEKRNLISDRKNLISDGKNLIFDGANPVSSEPNNVFYMKNMDSDEATFENSPNSVENSGTVVCDLCLFAFPDQNILQMHKTLVHSDCDEQKKTFSCHLCSKSFNMRGSLMVHRRVAHPVLSGGQVSLRNIERIKEMKASTSFDETTPQFTCKTCGKSFKKEQHLTQHERTHEVKQWNCDICSKVFSTKYFLKKHKRLHTGEMPYTCATCGKSFTFQQSYHKHLLYHSDEKPHVCVECGRAFKELSTLHNHQRIHTGEKPFACETCGKCFRQRVSYLVHRRIHTGVMPYKCTVCNKSFRYKVSERTHKCLNATQGHVVDRMSEVVEKLQKLEGTNSNLYLSSSKSNTPASGSLNTTTPPSTTKSNDTKTENSSTLQPDLNHSVHGVTPLESQPPCDKMDEGGQEYWTEIPKTPYHRNTSSNDNIFTADSSDDFLSFVLTPTFSPSEQFQNLTLSPDSVQDRDRGADGTRNTEQGIKDDDNFETINQQSLKELLDNVDGL